MKDLLVILAIIPLTLLFIFGTNQAVTRYTYYALNQAVIVKNFCVNKDKPEKNCQGKCHLKKLNKEEKKKAASSGLPSMENKVLQLFYADADGNSLSNHSFTKKKICHFSMPEEGFFDQIFRPPK